MAPARRMVKLGVNSVNKLPTNLELDSEVRELKAISSPDDGSADLDEDIEIEENEAI